MIIVSKDEFMAIEGSVLFREVMAVKKGDEYVWQFIPGGSELKIRSDAAADWGVHEIPLAEVNLDDFGLFSRGDSFSSIYYEDLKFPANNLNTETKYFLVYSKEEVKKIIELLSECL